MLEIRLRTKSSSEYLASVRGKILGTADVDVMLTGQVKVYKPNGKPLCVYLPKAIPEDVSAASYEVLHTIRGTTSNRGLASGSVRVAPKHVGPDDPERTKYRTYAKLVESNIIGSIEATGAPGHRHCRLLS